MIYGSTLGAVQYLFLVYNNRRMTSNLVLTIDWDLERHEYIVKMPSMTLLSCNINIVEHRVHPRNWVQIKDDEDCVYMDASTGRKFPTIGRGQWYNEGVLYFLFTNFNPQRKH